MKDHVWPCGHKDCPVAKPSKKAIEGHEKSHKTGGQGHGRGAPHERVGGSASSAAPSPKGRR